MSTVIVDINDLRALVQDVIRTELRMALTTTVVIRGQHGTEAMPEAEAESDEWLTMRDAMALTKFRDHMTLSRYAAQGMLPEGCAVRIGKKWRFHRGLLIRWMRSRSG